MINATGLPSIAQMVYQMNNPQTVNFDVGTADVDASAAAGAVVSDSGGGTAAPGCNSCGGSIDTSA